MEINKSLVQIGQVLKTALRMTVTCFPPFVVHLLEMKFVVEFPKLYCSTHDYCLGS